MKKFRLFVASMWQPAVIYGIAAVLVAVLLWYKLPTLVPAASPSEAEARASAASFTTLIQDPLYLPHKIGQFIMLKFGADGVLGMRLVSTVFAALIAAAFYRILQTWYRPRIAAIGTALFATSGWFLHAARHATPDIMFATLVLLLLAGIVLRAEYRKPWLLAACMLVLITLLYVPGMVWLIAAGFIWQRRTLVREMNDTPFWSGVFGGLALLFVLPLVWAFIQDRTLLLTWLGLPQAVPSIADVGQNLINIPRSFFFAGLPDHDKWLPGTPLINAFVAAMFILGAYAATKQWKLDRIRSIAAVFALGIISISLGGPVSYTLFVPFVYLIVTVGIADMLERWLEVFPRNPFARNLGIVLMAGVVGLTVYYQLTHYFVAWPNTPETKDTFSVRL